MIPQNFELNTQPNINKNKKENLLETCITEISKTLENAGWNYKGGILAISKDEIILDSCFASFPLQEAIKINYPNKKVLLQDKLTCYEIRDFLKLDLKPRENILTPWLPTQGLVMVYAPRGVGKTYFALTIGISVASGSNCLNWEICKPRGVLYLDGEMPATTMQQRLAKIIRGVEKEITAPFKIIPRDLNPYKPFTLNTEAGQAGIDKYLEGVELIIVDNISTLCSVKENDADAWTPIQEWALRMRARGISVLFIHHANKGGTARGTSKREDILDTVISLKLPPDYSPSQGAVFELHFEKSRGFTGNDAQSIQLTLTEKNNVFMWDVTTLEQTTYEKIIDLINEKDLTQAEVANELGINKSTVTYHVKRAKKEGRLNVK